MMKYFAVLVLSILIIVQGCSSEDPQLPVGCEDHEYPQCSSEKVDLKSEELGVGGIAGIVGGVAVLGAVAGGGSGGGGGSSSSGNDGGSGNGGGSGGSDIGGSGGGGNDGSNNDGASAETTIDGIFALGSGSATSRLVAAQVANATVEIVDNAAIRIALGQTNANGAYTFKQEIASTRYPLRIVIRFRGIEYSSAVVSTDKTVTAHVNEMTTVVTRQFQARTQSAAAFESIKRSVMVTYFGFNDSGNLNVPQDLFFSGDFSDSSGLGNALLETADKTGVSLLAPHSLQSHLFQNEAFIKNFVTTLRSKADPFLAIQQLSAQTGSAPLTHAVTTAVNSPNSNEADVAIVTLLSTTTTSTSTTTSTTNTTSTTLPLTRTTQLTFTNYTSSSIWSWYIKPSSSSTWGRSWLGFNILSSGQSAIFRGLPCGNSYDMKADRYSSTCAIRRSVSLTCGENHSWPLYSCTTTTSSTTSTTSTTTTTLPPTRTAQLTLTNHTSSSIWSWYIKPSNSSTWGRNRLANILSSGQSATVRGLPCGSSYNMKADRYSSTCAISRSISLKCGENHFWDIYLCMTITTTSSTTSTTIPSSGRQRFVIVGRSGRASYSTDGISWRASNHNNGAMEAIAYGNGRFVAVGRSGRASSSTDGIFWRVANHGNGSMNAITYGNRRFVAVGWSGRASYSTDGISWRASNHSSGDMEAIAYGNGRFVAVGRSGRASYSTDGISWRASNHNNGAMEAIAYGNGRFIAVGWSGRASYSTDGISWRASNHNNGAMEAIAYGNGRFIAVGWFGRASYSTDGISWRASNHNNGRMEVIAYGNGRFVAVGSWGSVSYSRDGSVWTATRHGNGFMEAIAVSR